ncbi:uncharacterized protein LOC135398940 [Ornithodoros turicata]|uniref:uncharacterized protein LOC135398940 n=1 Tax=Ornithodoros turicata TaxID=34597 RepID=UPI0031386F66
MLSASICLAHLDADSTLGSPGFAIPQNATLRHDANITLTNMATCFDELTTKTLTLAEYRLYLLFVNRLLHALTALLSVEHVTALHGCLQNGECEKVIESYRETDVTSENVEGVVERACRHFDGYTDCKVAEARSRCSEEEAEYLYAYLTSMGGLPHRLYCSYPNSAGRGTSPLRCFLLPTFLFVVSLVRQ